MPRSLNSDNRMSGDLATRPSWATNQPNSATAARQRQQRLPRAPADARRAHDSEHKRGQPAGDKDGPGDIERLALALRTALFEECPGGDECHEPDRDVDEQDPSPRQLLGEDPAQQRPGSTAGAGDRAPYPHRPGAGLWLPEGCGEDRQGGGREDRSPESLSSPGADEHGLILSEATEQAGKGEHTETEEEDPTPAEKVGRSPAEEEETGKGERVGIEHPLQLGLRKAKAVLDRRQRHIDDRHVEQHHELGHAGQGEHNPVRNLARRALGLAQVHAGFHSMCIAPGDRFLPTCGPKIAQRADYPGQTVVTELAYP